jgi:hypothetical protein
MSRQPEVDEIARRRELAARMGGLEKVARQHAVRAEVELARSVRDVDG